MKALLVTKQSTTELKICVECGSKTTYTDPQGRQRWGLLNRDKSKPLCKSCTAREYKKNNPEIIERNTRGWEKRNPEKHKLIRKRYRKNYPDVIKKANERRMVFKDKIVMLKENPRKGICSECGKSVFKGEIKRTNMHHEQYIESDPLKETEELCVSCHNKRRIGL